MSFTLIRSTYVKMLHGLDIFFGSFACFGIGVIEFAPNEVSNMVISISTNQKKNKKTKTRLDMARHAKNLLSDLIVAASAIRLDLSNYLGFNSSIANAFHHGQMLQVIMSLEEGIACEELHQDTTNAPDITWITPPEVEYDFWCPVMSGGNNRRVILIIKSSRSKVYQSDLRV